MIRVDDDMLSLRLEVGLTTALPSLLNGLADGDWRLRHAAAGMIARELVSRLRCFDIRNDADNGSIEAQTCLFPSDLGPIG